MSGAHEHIPDKSQSLGDPDQGRIILLSEAWRAATRNERRLSLILFTLFRQADPSAWISGDPPCDDTAVDGTFDFVLISRRLLDLVTGLAETPSDR